MIESPVGLGASLDGYVYVTDVALDHVQRWTTYGVAAGALVPEGTDTLGLDVSQDGLIFTTTGTTSGLTERMLTYDWRTGTIPLAVGGHGTAPGQFLLPSDVAADPLGRAFVVEEAGARAQAFSVGGAALSVFGSLGAGDQQFSQPQGIALGPDRTVYVADTGNHRISKWKVTVGTVEAPVDGEDRILTAIEASIKAHPADGSADIVVLATAFNWPDALGGSALAGTVNGPLLLTPPNALPASVAAEITRLAPRRVYVLGGTSAVSDTVMNAAKALTTEGIATRLWGPDRYATAIEIAAEVKAMRGADYDGTAIVCTGADFPDALAAAPVAAANGWPIYLTPGSALPATVSAAMLRNDWGGNPSNHGYIIGGPAVVSDDVADTLNAPPFMGYMRIWGANRYATAAQVARVGYTGLGMLMSRPALATGENYPDALAGGVLQGDDCCPLLLTRGSTLSPEAASVLTDYRDMVYEIRYLGGTSVLAPAVRTAARGLLW